MQLIAASVGTALAHGEKPHASKGIDYSKAEETPSAARGPEESKRTVTSR